MQNYIFDLYGTLIDIETDEESESFWQDMCEYYNDFGTSYSPMELKRRYHEYCNREEKALIEDYPEIKLEKVFLSLLEEGGGYSPIDRYEWTLLCAQYFRALSRKKLVTYKDTITLLKTLKQQEKRVYLLSNAQTCFTLDEMLKCKITPYFNGIYFSSDYGVKKPSRAFMEILLKNERLKVEESVMIGNDLTSDICVASKVGMKSIFINSYHHDVETLQKEAACLGDYHDYVQVDSLTDVLTMVKEKKRQAQLPSLLSCRKYFKVDDYSFTGVTIMNI